MRRKEFIGYFNTVVEVIAKQQAVIDILNNRVNSLEQIELDRRMQNEIDDLRKEFKVNLFVKFENSWVGTTITVVLVDKKEEYSLICFENKKELLNSIDKIATLIKSYLYDNKKKGKK